MGTVRFFRHSTQLFRHQIPTEFVLLGLVEFLILILALFLGLQLRYMGDDWGLIVGSFPANERGIHDLAGNVWEWIAEPFGGPSETYAALGVVRGGSWSTYQKDKLLSSCRNAIPVTMRDPLYGFRCVIAPVE